MEKAKLREARELIQEKDYEGAKHILSTILDNDTAMKWYLQLEQITESKTANEGNRTSWQKYRIALLAIMIIIFIVIIMILRANEAEQMCEAIILLGKSC